MFPNPSSMRTFFIPCTLIAITGFATVSCVEQSGKYKRLQAQLDSIQVASTAKDAEFEATFATLNELEQGLQSIREAENLLQIQSIKGGEVSASGRAQMKSRIQFIAATLEAYKEQVARLEKEQKNQSVQFQKRLKTIMDELALKEQIIQELRLQLEEKERQLTIQAQQITAINQNLTTLKADFNVLEKENERHVVKIEEQERQMYTAYFIVGDKAELIADKALVRGTLFRPARISSEVEQNAFNQIDTRIVTAIPLYAKKGKIRSIHPTGTYTLAHDADGMLVLHISNPDLFWEQTKYLVIQTR